MKNKFSWLLVIFYCLLSITKAQELPKNLIDKKKIYTLTQDEVVAQNENSLGIYQDELGYIVVTADVKKFTRNYHIFERVYGPFDRRLVEKPTFNLSSWGFIDSIGDTSVVILNGKQIGNFLIPEYPITLKIAKKTWAYAVINQAEGTNRVIINGKSHGPYADIIDYYLSADGGRWALAYATKPEECYVEFSSGTKLGPYKTIHSFAFIEGQGNRWVILAEKQGNVPIMQNGKEINSFIVVTHNGEVGTYQQEKLDTPEFDFKNMIQRGTNYGLSVVKDDKFYYLGNDKLYGPYQKQVQNIDMGEEYNKFNYIDKSTKTLHFTGEGVFSRNVERYAVSESRKTIAIIKNAGNNKDSLFINDKYFKGVFNKIISIKFAPKSEEWAITCENPDKTISLHFSNQSVFGPFDADVSINPTYLILGQGANHWAFYYTENKTGELRLFLDNKKYGGEKVSFLGTMAITKENNKEYFSWFTLEDKKHVYLNRLVLE
ncbi:MAG: hypothetical protein EAZ85_00810 [Bacteroidetes bacterium]|nr:MAG: hypothetical protein EAZ85_00810 [Bacteroidota bacterium]TAG89777.1 MAG: hypothetical protein EAZ20_05740 [Bacteroidota bacterium]